jgi:Protein of unknown function (DUF2971)
VSAQVSATDGGNASLVQSHPQLYHYTNEGGLKGIIDNNSLWATYFGDLSDANEIHELRVPLVQELAQRLVPFFRELRQKGLGKRNGVSHLHDTRAAQQYARKWANAVYDIVFPSNEAGRTSLCCITSFCSHSNDHAYEQENGLLSQWRGYGRDGFCLVFGTAALLKQLESERASFFSFHTDLYAAHYPVDGAAVLEPFTELLRLSETIIKTAAVGDHDPPVDDLWLPFISSATTFKHRGFYEEREVRLVVIAGTDIAEKQMRGVEGYKPLPLKVPFMTERDGRKCRRISLFGARSAPLPLERVIVGPSRSQDRNVEIARKIVGSKIPVSKSATPFIG